MAACVLSFTVGELIFILVNSFLRDWFLPADASRLLDMIFRYGSYLLSGAALGLLLGGLLTGWKKHWLWAGAFAAAQVAIYLVLTLLPGFRSILLLFLVVYGLQGLVNGLTFGLLARSTPAYRQPEPLPRLLLAGIGVYLLVGLLNYWLSDTFLFSNGMLNEPFAQHGAWVLLAMYTVFGLIEGFGIGLGVGSARGWGSGYNSQISYFYLPTRLVKAPPPAVPARASRRRSWCAPRYHGSAALSALDNLINEG